LTNLLCYGKFIEGKKSFCYCSNPSLALAARLWANTVKQPGIQPFAAGEL
jgi:hypothetical protein